MNDADRRELSEVRGDVASLTARVDVLTARFDVLSESVQPAVEFYRTAVRIGEFAKWGVGIGAGFATIVGVLRAVFGAG